MPAWWHTDTICCLLLSVQGLSHCFEKADGGGLTDVMVIEPISSSSLECMATGEVAVLLCPKFSLQHPPGTLLVEDMIETVM